MFYKVIATIILLIHFVNFSVFAQKESMDEMWGETKSMSNEKLAERAKLFDESNFGMFVHFGLYSHLAGKWKDKTYYGIGEWLMNTRVADIPVEEYKAVAKEYNPVNFNADSIAKLAKDAGMKYIIIGSKHHDGFAMFHSKVDKFNVVDATPFGRDMMKELSTACHEQGLGFGFYYSHYQDWTTPGGHRGPKTYPDGTPATFEDYFYKKCKPQVEEICTNYGDLDFVWFDTPGNMKKELVIELVDLVRELQPNAMLCSRIGHGMGDYVSNGDMEVPSRNIGGLWETCDTNNDSWGYVWYDKNFKTPKEILHRLISTVARGGTYLFNIGPDGKGVVPELGASFLKKAGKWINKYPQVIYNASASPWGHALPWGDVTTSGNSLFLSVFEWPQDGKLYLPGLESEIMSAEILGNETDMISFAKKKGWTIFNLPYKPADSPVSVIEIKLKNKAEDAHINTNLAVCPNIESELLADFAEVSDAEKKSIRWMEKFGEWKHVDQISKWEENGKAEWTVEVFEPGYYQIDLQYKGEGRLVWKIETDEGTMVQNQQAATEKYQEYKMGVLEFKEAGKHTISVSLIEGSRETSSLKSVIIRPVY
ncbi:MAG: alpha-L-fucosidase [Bacteroidota bacterium]